LPSQLLRPPTGAVTVVEGEAGFGDMLRDTEPEHAGMVVVVVVVVVGATHGLPT